MPKWGDILAQFKRGLMRPYQEQIDRADLEMRLGEERIASSRAENRRADAREGRESEEAVYRRTRRKHGEDMDAAQLLGLTQGNQGRQNDLDVFNASGGASGEAKRRQAKEDREQGTYNQNIRESNSRISNAAADNRRADSRLKLDEGRAQREETASELENAAQRNRNRYDDETMDTRIDETNNPTITDRSRVSTLERMYSAAAAAGNKEEMRLIARQIAAIEQEAKDRKAASLLKKASRAKKRKEYVTKPEGSPFDFLF